MIDFKTWGEAESYTVRVHEMKDETVFDDGIMNPEYVRSVRFLVEYTNHTNKPLKYRMTQWQVFDRHDFTYEFELRVQFYGNDVRHRLKEGVLNPGRSVRGWVAFQPTPDAVLSYVQFRPGYLTSATIDFSLPSGSVNESNVDKSNLPKMQDAFWQSGQQVVVRKPFYDFFERVYELDTLLTFRHQFPVYEGLQILEFEEATLYLHINQHEKILRNLSDYFKVV